MREYEIISITIENCIRVEIEFLDDRSRQQFVYPLNKGWEIENTIDNEPKFIKNIKQRVENDEFSKNIMSKAKITALKNKFQGKKFTKNKR